MARVFVELHAGLGGVRYICDARSAALRVLRVCVLHASAIAVCMCACAGTLCLGRLTLWNDTAGSNCLMNQAVTEHCLFLVYRCSQRWSTCAPFLPRTAQGLKSATACMQQARSHVSMWRASPNAAGK